MGQQEITYLNTASAGLLSNQSLSGAYAFYDAMQVNASTSSEEWRFGKCQQIRETLATFMDAPVNNVAFIPNFSFGITALVHAMAGSERVLLYKHDFPSLLDAFRLNNFDITWVDNEDGFHISMDKLKSMLLSERIDVLAISHVQWSSGFKINIGELAAFCRQHNIVFIVDATQSLGAVNISATQVDADAIIASNYKWMNAGFGSGVMYMADRLLEKYTPKIGGMNSYTFRGDQVFYEPSVRSYEPGHLNIAGLLLLEAAIKEKIEKGLTNIEAQNTSLTQLLLDGLKGMPVQLIGDPTTAGRSSIVLVKDENGLGKHLAGQKIIVTQRGGHLRISSHYYNTATDIDRLLGAIKAFYAVAHT